MNFIYDHLSASILSVAVFFILAAVQLRGGEATQDQAQYYSSKTHLLQATEMIEHDFENVGAGVARYDPIFITTDDSTFEFMAKVQPADENPSKISYLRVATEVVEIDGEEVQLYEVHRLVDDILTGKSPPTLREFEVELRNDDREEETDYEEVTTIHIRFVIAPPLGGEDELHEARWSHTFRPPNLSNY